MTAAAGERRYRLDPLDRSGVFLGLTLAALVVLGGAGVVSAVAVSVGAPLVVAAVPVAAGAGLAWGRVARVAVLEWVAVLAGYARRGRVWRVPLSLVDPSRPAGDPGVAVPACLEGLSLVGVDGPEGVLGVVVDDRAGTLSALVPVRGREFVLLARDDQERLLAGWGDVMAGFAAETGEVARLSWSSLAAPAGAGEHLAWVDSQPGAGEPGGAHGAYRQLLAVAGAMATSHEVLVTVTVNRRRARRSNARGDVAGQAGAGALVKAVGALTRSVTAAGLDPGVPLGPVGVADAIGARADPTGVPPGTAAVSLAARVGLAPAVPTRPMAVRAEWSRVGVDAAWHRVYWVAEWPRLEQHPDWFEPVLAWTGSVCREVTVIVEPVAPSAARRRIDRDTVRLASDADTASGRGRRVTGWDRRALQAVAEREAELVAGYAEIAYAGLVRVTAGDEDTLGEGCEQLEHLAREHGVELRCLYGRQDAAWAASLPLGLGLARTLT
ncbi:MAG: hypothetical protein HYX34_11130 [Actinobacteria bacterium]|nr:hypothetical protein [Actinomycetota bacterium]